MDRRRRVWVPLDTEFYFGDGAKILDRWGFGGAVVWTAFLGACQRSSNRGSVRWYSEDQLRHELGLDGRDLGFSLVDFFRWTGSQKWTKTTEGNGSKPGRTSSARRPYVVRTTSARSWDKWQTTIRPPREGDKNRRSGTKNVTEMREDVTEMRESARPTSPTPTPHRNVSEGEVVPPGGGSVPPTSDGLDGRSGRLPPEPNQNGHKEHDHTGPGTKPWIYADGCQVTDYDDYVRFGGPSAAPS